MPRLVPQLIAAGTVTTRATATNALIAATPSTVEDLQVRTSEFKVCFAPLSRGKPEHRLNVANMPKVMTVVTVVGPAHPLLLTATSPDLVEMIGTVTIDAAFSRHLPTSIDMFLVKIPALAAQA